MHHHMVHGLPQKQDTMPANGSQTPYQGSLPPFPFHHSKKQPTMRIAITERLINKMLFMINMEHSTSYTPSQIQSYTFDKNGVELFINNLTFFLKYSEL